MEIVMKTGDIVQLRQSDCATFKIVNIINDTVYVTCLATGNGFVFGRGHLKVVVDKIEITAEQLEEFFGMDNAEEIAGYLSENMRSLERGDISIKEFIAMHIPETDNTEWEEEK